MKKKFIVFAHYLILALAISLPFWLDWEIIAIIMIAYYLVFTRGIGYCPLTVWQFGTAEEGFIEKHIIRFFNLFGISIYNRNNLKMFLQYGVPLLLILIAIIRQVLVF